MKKYLAIVLTNNDRHQVSCLFEVSDGPWDNTYYIEKVIEDNSGGNLVFFKDENERICFKWTNNCVSPSLSGKEYWNGIKHDRPAETFNSENEALLWYKLNY